MTDPFKYQNFVGEVVRKPIYLTIAKKFGSISFVMSLVRGRQKKFSIMPVSSVPAWIIMKQTEFISMTQLKQNKAIDKMNLVITSM